MKKVVLLLAVVVVLGLAAQPVLATCPPNDVCANIPVDATAEDIAAAIGQEWNISPDFACSQTGASLEISGEAGKRTLEFSVDGDGSVDTPHTLEFDVAVPVAAGDPPFTIDAIL